MTYFSSKHILKYFPNLEELSFLIVFALPNASIIGLVAKICFSISVVSYEFFSLFTLAKYLIIYLAETVLPAPDSPETIID